MTFTFTRQKSSNNYFSGKNFYLEHAVRFDTFHNQIPHGILITNRTEAYGCFKDKISFQTKKRSFVFTRSRFVLYDINENEFARLSHKLRWLFVNDIRLQFAGADSIYKHQIRFGNKKADYDLLLK